MSYTQLNYVAGEWVAGESEIENINPSNLKEVIGTYAKHHRAN